ncbi:hypothetical protein BDN70DRAFT_883057 [Pholiota conissans]|uniref:Uncharacterized protein n=1 Tax=Pholiota conissans TaxID=109636 RepID=A0A9P5YVN1_9AGAR|nr:hypothetical protein BDN70DRAFT_883057 [Pholiota conissans]
MTEYNYAPQARREEEARRSRIARWRESNHHPFNDSYEDELRPSDSLSNVGTPPPEQYYYPQPQPAVLYPPQLYPQPYLQPQQYYSQPTYPVYYPPATQPFLNPTQISPYKKRSRRYGHHHTSGSRSHHASPSSGTLSLQSPSSGDLASRYVPTVSLQSASSMARSYSTPPGHSAGSYYIAYPGAYPAQQQQLIQPAPIVYPTSAPVGAPYGYPPATGALSPYEPSISSRHSGSRSHSHRSRSRSRSGSYSYPRSAPVQPTPAAWPAPANPAQPLVVPYGNGGHVVVPAGSTVINPQDYYYRKERAESSSFLGSLNPFKGSGKHLKRRSSRSSY